MRKTFALLFLFINITLYAQYPVPKYGDVDISDLKMTSYDKDSTAEALILFDDGVSQFNLNEKREFVFTYERHLQIKIFKKSAFDVADFSIKLYYLEGNRETLGGLKGATYNLVNGKEVKTKLDVKKIYDTQGKGYLQRKFAFPEVREGSIIELSYLITSDFLYEFRGWDFQYQYPARLSQYRVDIPEYFQYRHSSKGYLSFDISSDKQFRRTYIVHYDSEITPGLDGGRTSAQNYNLEALTNETTMAIRDVPAFKPEPDIDCIDNYVQSINFELISVHLPNQQWKDFTPSWASVNARMNGDEDFGGLLQSDKFISDTVNALCKDTPTNLEKALKIYSYVQRRMKWNGEYRLWASKGLKKPYMDRSGSSSEINLLLTMMLQNAGVKAMPVIISTRTNGVTLAVYPSISDFNSAITFAQIDSIDYLLDATSKYCPFGVLPPNDLNGRGRIINSANGDWVDLKSPVKYLESKSYNLDISSEGTLKGSVVELYDGYAGIALRNSLNSEKSSDDYFRKMQENTKGLIISKYSLSDVFNIYKPVTDTLNIEVSDQLDVVGGKIVFAPLIFERFEKNRYTLEERKYPVNYNYPISRTYVFVYTIPDGYTIESLPKSVRVRLQDNSASFSYSVQSSGNKINVIFVQYINKVIFLPAEYQNLKSLYDQIVGRQAEQIILKKAS